MKLELRKINCILIVWGNFMVLLLHSLQGCLSLIQCCKHCVFQKEAKLQKEFDPNQYKTTPDMTKVLHHSVTSFQRVVARVHEQVPSYPKLYSLLVLGVLGVKETMNTRDVRGTWRHIARHHAAIVLEN